MGWHLSVAALYGTAGQLDAFWIGLALPKAITDSLHFGILTFVFILVFHVAAPKERVDLVSAFFWNVLLFSIASVIVLAVSAPVLTRWMAPGFTSEQHSAATGALRWLSLMLVPTAITGAVAGVLNAQGRFTPFALARLVAPAAQVGTLFWLTRWLPSHRAALAPLVGAILVGASAMLAVCLPWLRSIDFAPRLRIRRRSAGAAVGIFFALTGFAILERLNQMSDRFFASQLAEGSVSILEFAWRFEIPVTHVLSFSVALPSFVLMVAHARSGRVRDVGRIALATFRLVALFVLPVVGFLVTTRGPLVELWFLHGAFPDAAATAVASLLLGLSIIFVTRSFGSIMVFGFLALGSTKRLLLVLMLEVVTNTALNAVLSPRFQLEGIVAATAIAMTAANAYLWRRFLRAVEWSWRELLGRSARAFAATGTSLVVLQLTVWATNSLSVKPFSSQALYLFALGLFFLVVHTLSAKLWGQLSTILGGGDDGEARHPELPLS